MKRYSPISGGGKERETKLWLIHKTQREAISLVTLEQGIDHCIYLHTCREHIAYESHLTLASSILIESMLPSRVVLCLFEGSYHVSAICSHAHPSQPSPSHFVLISHIFTLLVMFHVDWWGIHQCPPSIDLFLSMTTHYLGTCSRNSLVPWSLKSSVAGFLTLDSKLTPLVHVWMTLGVFDNNTSIHTP